MSKHARWCLGLLLGAGVIAASVVPAAGVLSASSSAGERRAAASSFKKGPAILEDVTGQSDPVVTTGLTRFRDTETEDEYLVDDRGVVKSYVNARALRSKRVSTASSRLSEAALEASARDYVASHLPEFDLSASRVTVEERAVGQNADGSPCEYETVVLFTQHARGIPTCNYVRLTMDPTMGETLTLNHDSGPLPDSASASVTGESARAKVADRLEMPVHTLKRQELQMWRDPSSHAVRLIWRVEMRTGSGDFGAEGVGIVDAQTGELLRVDLR
jgi:hypothetical protein